MTSAMVGVMTQDVTKCRICLTRDATVMRHYAAPNVPGTNVTHSMCDRHDAGLHSEMLEAGWVQIGTDIPNRYSAKTFREYAARRATTAGTDETAAVDVFEHAHREVGEA